MWAGCVPLGLRGLAVLCAQEVLRKPIKKVLGKQCIQWLMEL